MNRLRPTGSLLRSGDDGRRRGAVAIQVAIMLVGLIGFVSLGTEIVLILATSRHMQSAADAGALAAVTARIQGYPTDYKQEAYALAADAGFVNDAPDGTTVIINNPPTTGSYTGDAVEVLISQPQVLALAKVVYSGPFVVRARAVAQGSSAANYCILELDTSSTTGVSVTNGAVVNLNQCGLAANAAGGSAVLVDGGAILTTTSVSTGGSVSLTNGGTIIGPDGKSLVGTSQIRTMQPAVADPYSSTPLPAASGCKYGSLAPDRPLTLKHSNAGLQTINPDGVYCGGLAMTNDANVKMTAGVYVIKGGSFNVGGAVKLNGTGVTIFLTGSGSDYATATIGNGAVVNLSAPTTGATAGLVFFQDPKAPKSGSSSTDNFNGGSFVTLTGVVYFPSQTVVYSNGTTTASPCTQLVAWHIQFKGGASFNINCAGVGVESIGGGGGRPALVE